MNRSKRAAKRPTPDPVDHAWLREKLTLACDQLGEAIASARQADNFDQLDVLTPALATLWNVRWELQLHAVAEAEDAP